MNYRSEIISYLIANPYTRPSDVFEAIHGMSVEDAIGTPDGSVAEKAFCVAHQGLRKQDAISHNTECELYFTPVQIARFRCSGELK